MAGYSINRIPAEQKVFIPEIPNLWSTNGSGACSSCPSVEKYPGEGSIQNVLSVGQWIAYNIGTSGGNGLSSVTQTTAADTGDTVSLFVWIRTNRPVIVNLELNLLYPTNIFSTVPFASANRSISVTSAEWTLLRLYDLPVVADDAYNYPIGFRVTVEDIEDDTEATVNLSHPVIYGTLDFINNPAIIGIMSQIPEFIRHGDSIAEPLPYQLIRFVEAATIHTGEITELVNSFIYEDIAERQNSQSFYNLSGLVDPLVAKREYLPWLGQFSGTQVINPTTGFTPWANIPQTWQDIDLIDFDDTTQDSVEWSVLQDYNTEPAGLEEFLRWQVGNGYYGIKAGTQESITKSVSRVLTGYQIVNYEVVQPFAWTIKVSTLKSETPDAATLDIGASVPEILELVEPARPLGFAVIHELI